MVLYIRLLGGALIEGPEAECFHDLCATLSPLMEPDGPGRAFVRLGRGQAPEHALESLAARAIPALGQRMAAGAGANKLVAGAAARLLLATARSPLCRGRNTAAGVAERRAAGAAAEVLVVPPGWEAAFMRPLPLSFLWPAAPAVLAALERMGIATCGELAQVGEAVLRRRFGETGHRLARWAQGEDPRPVAALYPPQEVCERAALDDAGGAAGEAMRAVLVRLAAALARRLQPAGLGCGELRLRVVPAGGGMAERARRMVRPRNDPRALETAATALWEEMAGASTGDGASGESIAAVELAACALVPVSAVQLDLWEPPCRGGRDALEQALAGLRRRFAGDVVRRGGELPAARRERMLACWDPYRNRHGAPEAAPKPAPPQAPIPRPLPGEVARPWHDW